LRVDEKIKQLRRIEIVCLNGSKFEEFPIEFFLLKKLRFMIGLDAPFDDLRLDVYKKLPGGKKLMLENMGMTEFPYQLAPLPNITHLNLEGNHISTIDDRIMDFKILDEIIMYGNKLTQLPHSLLKNKNLKVFRAVANQIASISFEWIVFTNQQKIILDLQNNPIDNLPPIPMNFDSKKIEKNSGKILVDKNTIPLKQIELYQSVFGEEFIG